MTWYQAFTEQLPVAEIRARVARAHASQLDIPYWAPIKERIAKLPRFTGLVPDFGDTVSLTCGEGVGDDISKTEYLRGLLKDLRPWRKGPFSLCGIDIESEWRSDWKWNRIAPHLGELRHQRVADVGCNNGYYLFRMVPRGPERIVGFDPNARFYYQFQLLNSLFECSRLSFEPLGVEDMDLFPSFFDTILCLGVLYHRRDPVGMLESLKGALRSGGTLIIESITIPGDEKTFVVPVDRYCMMRNVWFLPTPGSLMSLLRRVGFRDVVEIDTSITTTEEQRRSEWAPFESLAEFLDPGNPEKTREGFPVPQRTICLARA